MFSAFLAAMSRPCWPLLIGLTWLWLRRPNARYYFSPNRDAVLAIQATRRGWKVLDHSAAEPGAGQGRALREALVPLLLAEADRQAVTIYGSAATRGLARQYTKQVPGVTDVGRGIRGRRLQRLPSP